LSGYSHGGLKVIPNSSFFICFLDDIKRPCFLKRIVTHNPFTFVLCKKVKEEVLAKTESKASFFNELNDYFEYSDFSSYSEVLRPFFAEEELIKGEHEVIIAAYIHHYSYNQDYVIIIDEEGPRKFLQKNFPELFANATGTVGFIAECYFSYSLLTKNEALGLLDAIKNSKFRVSDDILEKVRKEIVTGKRGYPHE